MDVFRYKEYEYYGFGLKLGISNLLTNGLALGFKKTIGKITQPINSYTRFPEYYYMGHKIEEHLEGMPTRPPPRILDVGSPKCFGLYLASIFEAEVHLTDISSLNIDEYRLMWNSQRGRAKGNVVFSVEDARSLDYATDTFDVVYSMSVIEHIDGKEGDSSSIRELIRVLKPGGLFLISVPFGKAYLEQQRIGLAGAVRRTKDKKPYFFQRIYDRPAFERRILANTAGLENMSLATVWRANPFLARMWGRLGENVRGALGFGNPLFSALINRSCEGLSDSCESSYGAFYSDRDVYGDLIVIGTKNCRGPT